MRFIICMLFLYFIIRAGVSLVEANLLKNIVNIMNMFLKEIG